MDHVGLLVHPGPAAVLVDSHSPERDDLTVRIRVELRELDQLLLRNTRKLADVFCGVGLQVLLELLEGDGPVRTRLAPHLLPLLEWMIVGKAVADVGWPRRERAVLVNEVPVDPIVLDHVASDKVHDREIRLGREDDFQIRQVAGAVREG